MQNSPRATQNITVLPVALLSLFQPPSISVSTGASLLVFDLSLRTQCLRILHVMRPPRSTGPSSKQLFVPCALATTQLVETCDFPDAVAVGRRVSMNISSRLRSQYGHAVKRGVPVLRHINFPAFHACVMSEHPAPRGVRWPSLFYRIF